MFFPTRKMIDWALGYDKPEVDMAISNDGTVDGEVDRTSVSTLGDSRTAHPSSNDLCDSLRRIADTIEINGGWCIAAIKVRAAAEEIERLRQLMGDRCAGLIAETERLRAALKWIEDHAFDVERIGLAERATNTLRDRDTMWRCPHCQTQYPPWSAHSCAIGPMGPITNVTAQKAYNCPKCNGLIPLGMTCVCQFARWAAKEPPHCPTCTCTSDSAGVARED